MKIEKIISKLNSLKKEYSDFVVIKRTEESYIVDRNNNIIGVDEDTTEFILPFNKDGKFSIERDFLGNLCFNAEKFENLNRKIFAKEDSWSCSQNQEVFLSLKEVKELLKIS